MRPPLSVQQTSVAIVVVLFAPGRVSFRLTLSPTCRGTELAKAIPPSLKLIEVATNSEREILEK
jgi:hypothetical protein